MEKAPVPIKKETLILNKISRIENKIGKIAREEESSLWNQLLGKKYKDKQIINEKYAKLLLQDDINRILSNGSFDNTSLKKRISLIKAYQLDTKIKTNKNLTDLWESCHKRIIDFKPVIDNKEYSRSDITEILLSSNDRTLREKAYKSYSILSKILETDLVSLIKVRNEEAKKNGFKSFTDYIFSQLYLNREDVLQLFEMILAKTHSLWKSIVKMASSQLKFDDINPWDLSYFLNNILISNTEALFPKEKIIQSFNDILNNFNLTLDELPVKIKERDIPYGGLCFVFDPGRDIRILANPGNGYKWFTTIFHEFGHAMQFVTRRDHSYTVVTGDPSFFLEAMAKIFEKFTQEDEWLLKMGVANNLIIDFRRSILINRIARIRSIIAQSLFEIQLYEDQSGEIDLRFKKHMENINGIHYPLIPNWAGNTLYVTHPIYLQNYVLAEMIAVQTVDYYKETHGSIFKKEFLRYLEEHYYSPCALIHWHEKVINATKSPLTVDKFLAGFNRFESEYKSYKLLDEYLAEMAGKSTKV